MKEEEASLQSTIITKRLGSDQNGGVFGKGRYKLWVLAAILLLAFWTLFTGSVTLKWSSGNFTPVSDDFDSLLHDDLDVLEVEEREKVVRHMWDLYSHSNTIGLPRFWKDAFEAAYEELISEVPAIQNSAVLEIAKMSLSSIDVIEPPPVLSMNNNRDRDR